MKLVLYTLLLLALTWVPTKGTDVGRLIPVEVVAVSENQRTVTVETDTGDRGEGASLAAAFADLEATAPGVIYLDTAEYLLLEPGMEGELATLRQYLKGCVRVCTGREGIPLDGVANYLSVHKPDLRLDELSDPVEIPWLIEEKGRYLLVEK